jgi:hypothetical protein
MTEEDAHILAQVVDRQVGVINILLAEINAAAKSDDTSLERIMEIQSRLKDELDYAKFVIEEGRNGLDVG